MKYSSVRSYLRPYIIVARRKTTINHAFAAAVAPYDEFDAPTVRQAMLDLGQDPNDLSCVYCGQPAQTWDHVRATVQDSSYSGFGHRLGNLVTCCKPCNSSKGNLEWEKFLARRDEENGERRSELIRTYLNKYSSRDSVPIDSPDYARLRQIREDVLELLREADLVAARIRASSRN